jgi:hypothetical protein
MLLVCKSSICFSYPDGTAHPDGILLSQFNRIFLSAVSSLLSWVLLGFLGAIIAEQPRAPEQVTSLVERGSIELKTPMRWQGRLRDEPARLPWGYGYEIEPSGVEFEGGLRAAAAAGRNRNFVWAGFRDSRSFARNASG